MMPLRVRRESGAGARFRVRAGQSEEQKRVRYRLLLQKAKALYFRGGEAPRARASFCRGERGDFRVFHVERKHCAGKPK